MLRLSLEPCACGCGDVAADAEPSLLRWRWWCSDGAARMVLPGASAAERGRAGDGILEGLGADTRTSWSLVDGAPGILLAAPPPLGEEGGMVCARHVCVRAW